MIFNSWNRCKRFNLYIKFGYKHRRKFSSEESKESLKRRNLEVAYYATAAAVALLGLSYASVPLYKVFCQLTGEN